MHLALLRYDELPAEPWRNGGGTTRVLAAVKSAARDVGAPSEPRVRVSLASIEASGPFSSFVGRVRAFSLVEGEVELVFDDGERALARAEGPALWFDGGRPVAARLVSGPALALNVIVDPDVDVSLEGEGELEGPVEAVVVAGRAGAVVGPHTLVARDAARVSLEGRERLAVRAQPGAWVGVVRWPR